MVPLKVEAIMLNGRPMAANLPTALTASFACTVASTREALNKTGVVSWYETTGEL